MASPEAFTVIKNRLDAAWSETPVEYENERVELPPTPAAFVKVEVFGDLYDLASIGGGEDLEDNLTREAGELRCHVLVPRNTGTLVARTHAKALANLFRGQEIGDMRFREASIGAGDAGVSDGNYYVMTATIDWERDE